MRPTLRMLTLDLFALASLAAPATAQDVGFRTDTLAPGVFALIRPVSPDLVAISNHLVIVDDEGVTLVDTGITPSVAHGVLAEIRRVTSKPVRWVINTHWHDDHVWGNQVFRDAFPDVRIVSHPFAYPFLRDSLPNALEANKLEYADALGRYERALRTGRTSRGDTVTAEMRTFFESTAESIRWFLPEMDSMTMAVPDLTISDELILRRPGREIHVRFLGRGNTGGDLVVHLPNERIIASGDLTVRPVPYSFGSFLGEWGATLERLKAIEADVIVPGHGEPMRDHAYIDLLQGLIAFTLDQAREGAAKGLDLEGTRAAIDFSGWEERFTHDDPVLARGFDAFWRQPAVDRAYLEVTGQLAMPHVAEDTLVAALSEVERSAWNAWKGRDSTFFATRLDPAARYVSGGGLSDRASLARQTAAFTCDVGTIELTDLSAVAMDEDDALLMGRARYDYTCRGTTTSAESWFTTAFAKRAGAWRIVFHQETDAPRRE